MYKAQGFCLYYNKQHVGGQWIELTMQRAAEKRTLNGGMVMSNVSAKYPRHKRQSRKNGINGIDVDEFFGLHLVWSQS